MRSLDTWRLLAKAGIWTGVKEGEKEIKARGMVSGTMRVGNLGRVGIEI